MKRFDNVSVVVPVYNGEKTIVKTIQSILIQDYSGNYEVVIIDDGSTDNTRKLVETSFVQNNVRYFYQENSGPASARNKGVRESKYDYVLFTDSDCVPFKNWISRIMQHFSDPKIAVVSGSYGIVNSESLLAKCIYNEILFRHNYLMPEYPKVFGSYNFCTRKKVFEEVGGFSTVYKDASGEDNDLSYRILNAGYKIYFDKKALVEHYHPTKILQYLKEQFRHGFWRSVMYLRHPKMCKGDDYTYWKDIIEVPISLFFIVLAICTVFGGVGVFLWYSCGFYLLELYCAGQMMKIKDALFYSIIMLFRALARTVGFVWGTLIFTVFCNFKHRDNSLKNNN